jgi:NUMOD3 motif.
MPHGNKGKKFTEEHKRKLSENKLKFFANGGIHSRLGKKLSKETLKKMSDSLKGRKVWNKGKTGIYSTETLKKMSNAKRGTKMSEETKEKLSQYNLKNGIIPPSGKGRIPSKETRKKLSDRQKGKLNHAWKGGITPINIKVRMSSEMKFWRKACMERDNFTDQKTNIRGGDLEVHHINNFADFPELRTSISNGITLSDKTHNDFHKKYGKRNNTREQLLEFLNQK